MRRFWLSLIVLTIVLAGYSFGQGPLTNALNLQVRTDSNGSLYTYCVVAGAQGPLRNFGNTSLRTYGGGDLGVVINGGTITPDTTCWSSTTKDSYITEIGANNPGAYTGGTNCAAGTLRWDWNGSRFNVNNIPLFITGGYLKVGTVANAITTTGAINIPNAVGIYAENAAGNGILTLAVMSSGNQAQIGDTNTPVSFPSKFSAYNNVSSAGLGVPATYGYGDVAAAVNVGTASIAAYTVGAADGTFEVGCNILVTTSTTHTFSCDVTYTDEGNTARTMVLPMEGLAGNFITNGLITNALGAGPYESAVMTIRAKTETAITVRTSAGGTFTTVTYNARGIIKQIG